MKRFTFALEVLLAIGGTLFLAGLQSCKHEPMYKIDPNIKSVTPTPVTDTNTKGTLDGKALYLQYCASCHGLIDTSTKRGATAIQIQTGIGNVNSMMTLSSLTIAQIQAIADALKTNPPSQDTTTNGALLYASYCASCHNPLSSSTKLGATASQIKTGIVNVTTMNPLSTLTTLQIQAIANALKTNVTPSDTNGAALYASFCASCHNPLPYSTKLGATASQIQTGIANVANMNSLSTLTSLQIQAIADALRTNVPPVDTSNGTSLYTYYCASCHNPLPTSAKLGATASNIQNAISTVGAMQSLSTLTTSQIQSIADVLASTPMPTDGASLYTINCEGCHRALPNSQVGGSSVSDIQSAISEVNKMKYLSKLTVAQIQAISGVLANINGGGD